MLARMHAPARSLLLAVLVAGCGSGPAPAPETAAETAAVSSPLRQLEENEERAESFAHAMLDLSAALCERDRARLEGHFAERLMATPFPSPAGPSRRQARWILAHDFALEARPGEIDRAAWLASLERLLRLEDSRIEVSEAQPGNGGRLDALLDLGLAGRDRAGRRQWLRGTARVEALPAAGGGWVLTGLTLESLGSLVAERDLLSEVAAGAGLAALDPPVLEHPLLGLAAYGAATADVDGDGLLDLFSTGADGNRLYRNRGEGSFAEIASELGIRTLPVQAIAPLFLDHDGDGDADLFLSAIGAQALLENRLVPDGRLAFRDVSSEAQIDRVAVGFSAVAGDLTGDGRPDIYVTSYNHYGQVLPDRWERATNGTPNLLFVNQGDGRFREEASERGIADSRWSYAAQIADVDDDGDLDLYVANDFGGGNPLYLNQGGRFRDAAAEWGVSDDGYGMGVSFGDPDNDGDLDLHVTRMSATAGRRVLARPETVTLGVSARLAPLTAGNALYENLGGHYREVSAAAGPFPGGWAWGGGFVDLDNDGFEDLHTPNGFLSGASPRDTTSLYWREVVAAQVAADRPASAAAFAGRQLGLLRQGYSFSGYERDLVCLNLGRGRFLDISGVSGADSVSDGRAAVYADLDNDGDLDIFLRAMHGPAHLLFKNQVGQERGFLRLALMGSKSGRDAFGATVRVKTAAGILTRVKSAGSGFLSQSDPRLLFGLGDDARSEWIEVAWPSGLRQRFPGAEAGASLLLVEGEAAARRLSERRFALPDP